MLDFLLPDVHIGFNPVLPKEQRHGVAWVQAEGGGVVQQPFVVNKPKRLLNPSNRTIENMFAQISKMGMVPVHLEIMLNNRRTIYKQGVRAPLITHLM
jgi:hypothetical protein